MPFIGKQPKVGAYQLIDSITTSATATYALTVDGSAYFPESARNLIVSLNGVTQAPESAYTVSGSNIVFDSALTASDVIDYIMVIGDAVDIGTPSDGTVGTSQMSYPLGNFSSTGIDDNATSTAITVDASENVGIGESSPQAKLDVSSGATLAQATYNGQIKTGVYSTDGDLDSGIEWQVRGDGAGYGFRAINIQAGGGNQWRLQSRDNSASWTDNIIVDGGNVGIGVPSPAKELEVAGTILVDAVSYAANQDGAYLIAGTDGWTGATTNWDTFGFQHKVKVNSGGVPRITIDNHSGEVFALTNSSKVGIGTSDPSPKFHVTDGNGGGARIDGGSATSGESAYLWCQNGRARFGYDGGRGAVAISDYNQNGSTTGKHICFDTGGSERMRLYSTGSLLLGKTTPNVGGADGIEFLSNGTIYATVPSSSTNTYHLYNRSTASYLFYVKGNGGINNVSGNNTNLSDERSKRGIVDSGEWLNRLCQIPVRNFRYNHEDDSGKLHLGVISQEVEAVAPELVEKNSFEVNGEARDSVYNSDLQFAMLKAIQEQQAIIEDLQTRLSALEAN